MANLMQKIMLSFIKNGKYYDVFGKMQSNIFKVNDFSSLIKSSRFYSNTVENSASKGDPLKIGDAIKIPVHTPKNNTLIDSNKSPKIGTSVFCSIMPNCRNKPVNISTQLDRGEKILRKYEKGVVILSESQKAYCGGDLWKGHSYFAVKAAIFGGTTLWMIDEGLWGDHDRSEDFWYRRLFKLYAKLNDHHRNPLIESNTIIPANPPIQLIKDDLTVYYNDMICSITKNLSKFVQQFIFSNENSDCVDCSNKEKMD